MIITKKYYLIVAMFSSLLFALILALSIGNNASAQSSDPGEHPGCNDKGCLWEETNCDFQPGNPNNCPVACHIIEGLTCEELSSTDCNVSICQ